MGPLRISQTLESAFCASDDVVVGVDLGSRTSKAILLTGDELHVAITPTGTDARRSTRALLIDLLASSHLRRDDVIRAVGTGYGSVRLDLDGIECETLTEITCHARGAFALRPDTRTIVDIGGQDSKVITLSPRGDITDFVLNDRCAAGTGRFLERAAQLLDLDIESFSELSLTSTDPCSMSSQCVVFAESEIVSLKASGVAVADIAAGVHEATAWRLANLMKRVVCDGPLFFSGGVSDNIGMRQALANVSGFRPISGRMDPIYTGALGAALTARRYELC